MRHPARFLTTLLVALLTACSGYQLGGNKPVHLSEIHSIHLALVKNQSQMPRAAAHATNAIADTFLRDGTYRLAGSDQADARLETTLSLIDYSQISTTRNDSLRSNELEMTVYYDWVLLSSENPLHILQKGRSSGTTRFFLGPNLQTDRQNALPDALNRAAVSLVGNLADSF